MAETTAFHKGTLLPFLCVYQALSASLPELTAPTVVVGGEITLPACLIPVPARGVHWECLEQARVPSASLAAGLAAPRSSRESLKLPQQIFTKLICALLAVFGLPC